MKSFQFIKDKFQTNFDINTYTLKISGQATAMNPHSEYSQFNEWFDDYMVNPHRPTYIIFDLEFSNSSFMKYIVKFFMSIENSGFRNYFNVKWICRDEEVYELAEDLQKVSSIKFEIAKWL